MVFPKYTLRVLQELELESSLPLQARFNLIFFRWFGIFFTHFYEHFTKLQKYKGNHASDLLTLGAVWVIFDWKNETRPITLTFILRLLLITYHCIKMRRKSSEKNKK